MSSFTTINPATGTPLRSWQYWDEAQIEAGLALATTTQRRWRHTTFAKRSAVLHAIAKALAESGEALAHTMTLEMGKPIGEARREVQKCAWVCRFYADHAAEMLSPQTVEAAAPVNEVHFAPLGVVFSVMPWNFPAWQVFRFAAPAWMAGNAVVMKHAPNTFGTAAALASLCAGAGLPDGLLVDARVDLPQVPDIIADRRIAAVTVTGSDRAGRAVAQTAGSHLKKCVLELGGSDPFIVLDDADLDAAVEAAVASRCLNNGQSCIAAKRFFVESAVYEPFVSALTNGMNALKVGDPLQPQVQLGPLARPDLCALLTRQVRDTLAAGAHALCGGVPDLEGGAFYPPTVLVDIPPDTPAADEELFGPVASVWQVPHEQEAIARANASRFGLSASVWTRSPDRARQLAAQLESGGVFVNQSSYSDPRLPFGGIKDSGYGRELGVFGIREFVNVKTISLR
ncbi:MAG TPA: NADP-dependent succinic semialdehyde dehydrogenase [Deltaproteobacteria bacterium]|mgnify:CR=1 FL=1|nr:NADP-dependent succinic semialdehyde dehydrogenase [Deltaproteobacteria bacterium]